MKQYSKEELAEILRLHRMWRHKEPGGIKANLSEANLSEADLRGANLSEANLGWADLRGANLSEDNLSKVNLGWANLSKADLRGANLSEADLRMAIGLDSVTYDANTSFFALQCPEKGAYIAYKKADGLIIELEITADALRSSATSRKCRASKAKVLSITDINGNPAADRVVSNYDNEFIYTVGETVEVPDFDEDRWNECAPGIHHFITRHEAVLYT